VSIDRKGKRKQADALKRFRDGGWWENHASLNTSSGRGPVPMAFLSSLIDI